MSSPGARSSVSDFSRPTSVCEEFPALRNPHALVVAVAGVLVLGICATLLAHPGRLGLAMAILATVMIAPYSAYCVSLGVWSYAGRERICVTEDRLIVEKRVAFLAVQRAEYEQSLIEHFHVRACPGLRWAISSPLAVAQELGFGAGPIYFEYQGVDVRLAESLRGDSEAAERLAERLRAVLRLA